MMTGFILNLAVASTMAIIYWIVMRVLTTDHKHSLHGE